MMHVTGLTVSLEHLRQSLRNLLVLAPSLDYTMHASCSAGLSFEEVWYMT